MAAPGAGLPMGGPGQPAPDRAGGWRAVTATERGAAHRAAGTPNQDAVATIPYGTTLLVAIGQGQRLQLAQIGDGGIVGIGPDGTALLLAPAPAPGAGAPCRGARTAGAARGGAAARGGER